MRIFDQDKITEIKDYDRKKYYLKSDKLLLAHHEAVEAREGQWHYETVSEYPNGGKDVKKIWDIEPIEAAEAYDEYEDIQILVEYTEAEKKDILRQERSVLLYAFDKWEKAVLRSREEDDEAVMAWYQALLDLDVEAFENVPQRVEYYL